MCRYGSGKRAQTCVSPSASSSTAQAITESTSGTSGTRKSRYCGDSTFAKATKPTAVAAAAAKVRSRSIGPRRASSHQAAAVAASTSSEPTAASPLAVRPAMSNENGEDVTTTW